ncbi:hypothetical protein N656DRAFT_394374 [Canariomyces notabilis]|uniref:Uncharacterized protein n=1 Tax=Canariomyces notabilis TaxID=2074819 RepID=A0AAN6TJT6_9PEZI|nr:hypothetical protein N656DRAFT_394374 [Canariomyces arenarius]
MRRSSRSRCPSRPCLLHCSKPCPHPLSESHNSPRPRPISHLRACPSFPLLCTLRSIHPPRLPIRVTTRVTVRPVLPLVFLVILSRTPRTPRTAPFTSTRTLIGATPGSPSAPQPAQLPGKEPEEKAQRPGKTVSSGPEQSAKRSPEREKSVRAERGANVQPEDDPRGDKPDEEEERGEQREAKGESQEKDDPAE